MKTTKLSKTEKIKRLRAIKKWLNTASVYSDFMCHFYESTFYTGCFWKENLVNDIPELFQFKPEKNLPDNVAWVFKIKGNPVEDGRKLKQKAIDKAIKLIQSKK